jgi:KipI family sensor histidine kinase inhibitor
MVEGAAETKFLDAGDMGLIVEFGTVIDPVISARVVALDKCIQAANIPGLIETVVTYRSLLIQLDPLVFDVTAFKKFVLAQIPRLPKEPIPGRRWRVPVVYGGEFGIDLEDVAKTHGLTPREVIKRHTAPVYRVYAMGFMPGYTYLGGLDQTIATPRRLNPRAMTPAGTISIGGIQALVAGEAMPSGWHLLGRTPIKTFLASRSPVALFAPGDEIVFSEIETAAFEPLSQRAAAGEPLVVDITP